MVGNENRILKNAIVSKNYYSSYTLKLLKFIFSVTISKSLLTPYEAKYSIMD